MGLDAVYVKEENGEGDSRRKGRPKNQNTVSQRSEAKGQIMDVGCCGGRTIRTQGKNAVIKKTR